MDNDESSSAAYDHISSPHHSSVSQNLGVQGGRIPSLKSKKLLCKAMKKKKKRKLSQAGKSPF